MPPLQIQFLAGFLTIVMTMVYLLSLERRLMDEAVVNVLPEYGQLSGEAGAWMGSGATSEATSGAMSQVQQPPPRGEPPRGEPQRPAKLCPPTRPLHSSSCPKAVCVQPTLAGGLGHRLTNVLQGHLLSLAVDVPLATPGLEHAGDHGGYKDANVLFRSEPNVVACPPQYGSAPVDLKGWTLQKLDGNGSPPLPPPNTLPFGNSDMALTDAATDGCEELATLRNTIAEADCNTLFVASEFWPRTYEAASPTASSDAGCGASQAASQVDRTNGRLGITEITSGSICGLGLGLGLGLVRIFKG